QPILAVLSTVGQGHRLLLVARIADPDVISRTDRVELFLIRIGETLIPAAEKPEENMRYGVGHIEPAGKAAGGQPTPRIVRSVVVGARLGLERAQLRPARHRDEPFLFAEVRERGELLAGQRRHECASIAAEIRLRVAIAYFRGREIAELEAQVGRSG